MVTNRQIHLIALGAAFLFLGPVRSMAQSLSPDDYLERAGDHAALYQGRILTMSLTPEWVTHPYLNDAEFHEGQVSYNGILYPSVKLRYNINSQRLEVLSPIQKNIILPIHDNVDYFVLNDMRFLRRGDRYVGLAYGGKSVSLEVLYDKVRAADENIEGVMKKKMKTTVSYNLRNAEGDHPAKNLKSITKLYPQYKKQLEAFSLNQSLRFRGDNRLSSLAVCTQCLDEALTPLKPLTVHATPEAETIKLTENVLEGGLTTDLPAYTAFRQGGSGTQGQHVNAEDTAGNSMGISALDPLTEDRIMKEVEVTAFHSKVFMSQMGAEKFRPAQLRNVPMAFGEADVMKMVQTLPGVKTMGEASSGFNVRGGAADQNLILFGGSTIYNPMHMFGLFSAFNADAINEAELYKSGIPSQYGGRISSVMNIAARNADKQKWHGSASLGVLTSKAHLEMPLVKDKLSLLLAARTTYSDWMLKLLPDDSEYHDGRAGFYDLNGTLAWTLNPKHIVKAFGYYSHDRFSFTPYDKYGYTNGNGSVEWKSFWTDQLSSTITAGMSHYDYQNDDTKSHSTAARLSFDVNEAFFKGLFSLKNNDKHTWQWGWDAKLYNVNPGTYGPLGEDSNIQSDQIEKSNALEGSLFAEDEWQAAEKIKLNGGVRYTMFNAFLDGKEKTYQAPEFRLSSSYTLTDNSTVKLGFNTMHQFIHKVSNTIIMSPTDTWVLSNAAIKPQRGWQVAGGYYLQTNDHNYEVSAELYYKHIANYLTYRSAGQLIMNHELENDVIKAQGRAYGIELQLRKPFGKLNGWVSYSYSRTFLRQHDKNVALLVNDGKWYPAEYDRPHEVKFVGNYKFTRRLSISLNLDYSTGRPTTVPAGSYYDQQQKRMLPYYSERNGHRIPDYFRMDGSFNIEPSHHLANRTHSWFSIGVYNMLGRRNAYSVYYESTGMNIQGYKLSIFGAPIPYISYNIKF